MNKQVYAVVDIATVFVLKRGSSCKIYKAMSVTAHFEGAMTVKSPLSFKINSKRNLTANCGTSRSVLYRISFHCHGLLSVRVTGSASVYLSNKYDNTIKVQD